MEWHNILNASDPELDRLAERYGLHPLHIEDCRHRDQNAKIEEGETYVFTVLKALRFDADGVIEAGDLDIFLGSDFVITVLECDFPDLIRTIEQVRRSVAANHLRADQVYYRIVDKMVDAFLPVLDKYDETIDKLDDQALNNPQPETLASIFDAKRSLILLRRILANTRDVAGRLQRTDCPMIGRDMWPFLRDIYDHVTRNLDTVEMQRDLLNGTLDVYLSSVANRTNQVMKVLTVLGTVSIPAIIVTGLYGMNIKGLPGAESPHALWMVGGAVFIFTALLLWLLKRYQWL
jgi:magnesium transporter